MKLYLIFVSLGLVAGDLSSEWTQWKELHGKEYKSLQIEELRFKIFEENRLKIQKHNEEAENALHTYTLGMNQYGDLLHSEYLQGHTGFAKRSFSGENTFIFDNSTTVPSYVNWFEFGAVTRIKQEGRCKASWAYSATGSIEGQYFINNSKLLSFSEQQLVDCSTKFGNFGCGEGSMDNAFKYVIDNKGIATGDVYRFNGNYNDCKYNQSMAAGEISSFKTIETGSEEQLLIAVAEIGPISVAIDATSDKFKFYKNGIYQDKDCSSTDLDHAVLVVGYGTDKERQMDYWIVKNSWAISWGDQGYIKMRRNKMNMCGIATMASYPII